MKIGDLFLDLGSQSASAWVGELSSGRPKCRDVRQTGQLDTETTSRIHLQAMAGVQVAYGAQTDRRGVRADGSILVAQSSSTRVASTIAVSGSPVMG